MARVLSPTTKRTRISLDVTPELLSRVRVAAALRELSVREYLIETIVERLYDEMDDEGPKTALTAAEAPSLADLWDNPQDAVYDQLYPR
jgi:uncharacterized protein (DUF1778 family)